MPDIVNVIEEAEEGANLKEVRTYLDHAYHKEPLMAFAKKTLNTENVVFINEYKRLREMLYQDYPKRRVGLTAINEQWDKIYRLYVVNSAPQEVNLGHNIEREFAARIDSGNISEFGKHLQAIANSVGDNVKTDMLQNYLSTHTNLNKRISEYIRFRDESETSNVKPEVSSKSSNVKSKVSEYIRSLNVKSKKEVDDLFYLKSFLAMYNANTLHRPFDTFENKNMMEEARNHFRRAYNDLKSKWGIQLQGKNKANSLPNPNKWQYQENAIKRIRNGMLQLEEVDAMKKQFNEFLKWENKKNIYDTSKQEIEKRLIENIIQYLTVSFVFHTASQHSKNNYDSKFYNDEIKDKKTKDKNKKVLSESELLRSVALSLFIEDPKEIINIAKEKALQDKLINDDSTVIGYCTGKIPVQGGEGALKNKFIETIKEFMDNNMKFSLLPVELQNNTLLELEQKMKISAGGNPAITKDITDAFNGIKSSRNQPVNNTAKIIHEMQEHEKAAAIRLTASQMRSSKLTRADASPTALWTEHLKKGRLIKEMMQQDEAKDEARKNEDNKQEPSPRSTTFKRP